MNLTTEQRAKKSAQARQQWADKGGTLRQAVAKANTKVPPANAAEIVERACENGCTVEQIAGALGVDRKLFGEWRERYPEIETAMGAGRAVEHDLLVGKLFQMAMKGAVVPAIFLLKARHGYQEGVALVQNSVSVTYQLPAALSPAEYIKTIEAETTLVPPDTAKKLTAQPEVRSALKRELTAQRRELEKSE